MKQPFSRILYMGTPEFAVAPVQKMVEADLPIIGVVCQPDRRAGRGKKWTMPEVKIYAQSQNIPVMQPEKITKEVIEKIASLAPDLIVVCAYGKMLPQALIDVPKQIINIHASLLPAYRGAAPIHHAIKDGQPKTGVSIMKIVKKMDAGDYMLQKELSISKEDTLDILTKKLSDLGAQALLEALALFDKESVTWTAQDPSKVSFAPKILTETSKINWHQPARHIQNFIRSLSPEPSAYTYLHGEKIKIQKSKCVDQEHHLQPGSIKREKKSLWIAAQDQWIDILTLQKPGKKSQSVQEFLNGYRKELTHVDP